MAWQDWVLAVSGIILGASLIPTIRGDDKPALSTALLTTVIIAVVCFTMATMGLWLSAATNILIVGAWGLISWQKFHQIRRARHSVSSSSRRKLCTACTMSRSIGTGMSMKTPYFQSAVSVIVPARSPL